MPLPIPHNPHPGLTSSVHFDRGSFFIFHFSSFEADERTNCFAEKISDLQGLNK